MKYIFPRQFGLHNVFTSTPDSRQTIQPFKDYTMREDEISLAEKQRQHVQNPFPGPQGIESPRESVKIPKRLRGEAVQLVQKLQSRNNQCSYVELLRYYCPSEVSETGRTGGIN